MRFALSYKSKTIKMAYKIKQKMLNGRRHSHYLYSFLIFYSCLFVLQFTLIIGL